jgi:hypothetical protein
MTTQEMFKEIAQTAWDNGWNGHLHVWVEYALPFILNDNAFMQAVYGEDQRCVVCGSAFMPQGYGDPPLNQYNFCGKCDLERKVIPRYQFIQQQAIIKEGDEQVKYLYERMGENEAI